MISSNLRQTTGDRKIINQLIILNKKYRDCVDSLAFMGWVFLCWDETPVI